MVTHPAAPPGSWAGRDLGEASRDHPEKTKYIIIEVTIPKDDLSAAPPGCWAAPQPTLLDGAAAEAADHGAQQQEVAAPAHRRASWTPQAPPPVPGVANPSAHHLATATASAMEAATERRAREAKQEEGSARSVVVRGLDRAIDNSALYDTFGLRGKILTCTVASDPSGNSQGYGFVHYETEEAAQKAIKHINSVRLGRNMV